MSDIKSCFVSRYGNDGLIIEADFSQLEVVGLAILSKDTVLRDDLVKGLDMHRIRAAELFSIAESEVTPNQRFLAKRLSFQLQYGAGAKSMAEKNKISLAVAEKFISLYYSRYSRVKQWQEEVVKEVKASRGVGGGHTPLGYPSGVGTYTSPTGRMYKFKEYDAPPWRPGSDPTFSPTEMKNYPVQGFATADIMALYRSNLFDLIHRGPIGELRDNCKLVNTVHDSVMLDCYHSALSRASWALNYAASLLPEQLKEIWGIDTLGLPLVVNIKSGPDWASLK